MSNEFVKREELAVLREDLKEHTQSISAGFDKLTEKIEATEEGWRERTHNLDDKINLIALEQAVQKRELEGLRAFPQLDALREVVADGFKGINNRLDRVNGRLDRHTSEIADTAARVDVLGGASPAMPFNRRKVVMAAGGVGALAVLHSLFEMLKSIGPALLEVFHRTPPVR